MTDDAFDRTMRHHDVRELACKRIALFGDEDLAEWDRECMSDHDWNPRRLNLAVTALRLLPKPDLNILGEM